MLKNYPNKILNQTKKKMLKSKNFYESYCDYREKNIIVNSILLYALKNDFCTCTIVYNAYIFMCQINYKNESLRTDAKLRTFNTVYILNIVILFKA